MNHNDKYLHSRTWYVHKYKSKITLVTHQRDFFFLHFCSFLLCTQLEVSKYVFRLLEWAWRTCFHFLVMYLSFSRVFLTWNFNIFLRPNRKVLKPRNLATLCWHDNISVYVFFRSWPEDPWITTSGTLLQAGAVYTCMVKPFSFCELGKVLQEEHFSLMSNQTFNLNTKFCKKYGRHLYIIYPLESVRCFLVVFSI